MFYFMVTKVFNLETVKISMKFNHCFIIMYYARPDMKNELTLGMHYDKNNNKMINSFT